MTKFYIVGIIPSVYLFFRFILPMKIRWYWKIPLTLVLIFIFHYLLMKFYCFPVWFNGKVPDALMNTYMYIQIVAGLFFGLYLLADIVQLLFRTGQKICGKSLPPHWMFRPMKISFLLMAAACVLSVIGLYYGKKAPRIQEVTLSYRNLPPEMDGMKLVLIADTHVLPETPTAFLQDIVRRTNQLDPDFVFLVGDLVDSQPHIIGNKLNEFSKFRTKHGVYFVTGNHENWNAKEAWFEFFRKRGIHVLTSEHENIPELKLSVIGLNDKSVDWLGKNRHEDLPKAMEGVPAGYFKILLSHRPNIAEQSAEAGIDLQLSGHTHGGMILVFHWILAAINDGFVSGLYHVDNMFLYVTNGLCVWRGFPVRLGVPQEIVLIRLKRMENEPERKFFDVF